MATSELDLGRYKLGWSDVEDYYVYKPKNGVSASMVQEMSWMKGEPQWMTDRRLKALRCFERRPMPTWGGDMSGIDFADIFYYIKPIDKQVTSLTHSLTHSSGSGHAVAPPLSEATIPGLRRR